MVGCAQSGQLSGGPKDEAPPVLLSERSSSNLQTNYDGEPLVFYFDEFVEVKNKKNIDISPTPDYNPKITARGKKVTVKFHDKELLKDNMTYRIDFSKTIVDFTEGNALESLEYVFSTGDRIDSLSLRGKIVDASTGDGIADMLIMLYDSQVDSVVYHEKPLYYVKSGQNGAFNFNYLRAGEYKIFGLEDKNANKKYDLTSEKIAFDNNLVQVSSAVDEMIDIVLEAFIDDSKKELESYDTDIPGVISLKFNQAVTTDEIALLVDQGDFIKVIHHDEAKLFYNDSLSKVDVLVLGDTLSLRLNEIDTTFLNKKVKVKKISTMVVENDTLVLDFDVPITSISMDSIVIIDTIGNVNITDHLIDNDRVKLALSGYTNRFNIVFDTMTFTDLYDRTNDSLSYVVRMIKEEDLRDISFELINIDSTKSYFVELIKLGDRYKGIRATHGELITFNQLVPESYEIKVIQDDDNNGKWTSGNYWEQRQPEKHILLPFDLKSNEKDTFVIDWKAESFVDQKESDPVIDSTNVANPVLEKLKRKKE